MFLNKLAKIVEVTEIDKKGSRSPEISLERLRDICLNCCKDHYSDFFQSLPIPASSIELNVYSISLLFMLESTQGR